MKKWMMGLAFLLLVSLLFFSCGKLSRKGTAPTNLPPEVFLVNIPPDGTNFIILSKVYWYGFDQDGYISRYQYLVIPDTGKIILKDTLFIDTVMYVYIDSLFVKTIEQVKPEDWNDDSLSAILKRSYPTIPISRNVIHAVDSVAGNGSWDNVMLFASMDTAKMVGQYFFVRGVDNEGSVSRIWKPDSERGSTFRLFNRTNRPPITTVDYDSLRIEYCLPETTVDWKGIRIYWSAQDPDYPPRGVTPPLSFKWVLLGPFGSKSDINQNQDSIYYSSWDDTYKIPWVDNTSRLLVDLENAPGKDYGWYQFMVQARDDAFVPDTTPAKVTFKIIKPPFLFKNYNEKSVLLVDVTNGGLLFYPQKDSLRAFYRGFLQELKDSGIISRCSLTTLNPPPETLLSQYKLVIYINEGRYSSIQGKYNTPPAARDTGFIQIERYLRVGGRVWMIGYNNFGLIDLTLTKPQYMPIDPIDTALYGYTNTMVRVANNFCGVTGYFNPAMEISRTEEMIAAEPYKTHPELPLLEVDSVKLKVLPDSSNNGYFYGIQPLGESLKGIPWAGYEGVWNVNYNERLYTFISYKGSESSLHGRACASRAYSPNPLSYYDEPGQPILQWRTAEFCFPAFAMKKEPMLIMMGEMVEWFMKEEAYLP